VHSFETASLSPTLLTKPKTYKVIKLKFSSEIGELVHTDLQHREGKKGNRKSRPVALLVF
jgi:hypothetical protein